MKKNIYFICNGTTFNDIVNSVDNTRNTTNIPKRNMFTDIPVKKSIKRLNDPPLLNIGIKQLYMFQENPSNKSLLRTFDKVYTSLNTSSIESAYVLFCLLNGITIIPLPNMVNNADITNLNSLNTFKNKFVNNYWKNKDLKINNIKKINANIDWSNISITNTEKTFIKNNHSIKADAQYGFNKFNRRLLEILKRETNNNIMMISNNNILNNIMDRCIDKKNNKNNMEYTSLWKIEVEYDTNNIRYMKCQKMYPVTDNYKPLEIYNNSYGFKFNNNMFELFKMNNKINIDYAKQLLNILITSNKPVVSINTTTHHTIQIDNFK